MKRDTNGKGLVLYEEVLQKNFEIIQTFLNKFPAIFKKQDYFDDTIKKINDKLAKLDQEDENIRQQIHMTATLLDKKIVHIKESNVRNSRVSMRNSQEIGHLEQRKNSSIFRISSAKISQPKEASLVFSKEKIELLNQMDKKQEESNKRMEELQSTITQLQQRMNFVSVISGRMEESMDKVLEEKLDKHCFQKLQAQYENKFEGIISDLAQQKYRTGRKLIEEQFSFLQSQFKEEIKQDLSDVKKKLLGELEKKAAVTEFRDQLSQIKLIIENMVEESVDSFASKEETKIALTLFEKKISKTELVLEQILNKNLNEVNQDDKTQGLLLGCRKQRDGIMNNFGRKRRS